jgi:hypothetical protein
MARNKAEAKGRAARKAARTSRSTAQAAVGLKASELLERVRDVNLDDLAERTRTAVRDAKVDERAAELADRARTAVRDAHLDERAAELAARVRESEAGQRAAAASRRTTDQALERVGEWLMASGAAERLGVVPVKRRRGRSLLFLLLGAAIGFVAARFLQGRSESEELDVYAETSQWTTAAEPPSGPAPSAVPSVPPAGDVSEPGQPLEEEIRSSLRSDPRTAELGDLSINVAESTVFVRGNVPEDADRAAITEVVANVPGVTDVDLEVTTA